MASIIEVRKTYKYRLYTSERDGRLHNTLNIAGIIWNHLTALQKRYYRLTGKHISEGQMKQHIAKLRMNTQRFAHWRLVGSQAVQDICERHEKVYDNFFHKRGGLPHFKKVKKYTSFTLKQAGWKLQDHQPGKHYRQITVGDTGYKFVYHRPLKGEIKTITVKRDAAGRLWVCFSVVEKLVIEVGCSPGKIGAFDFGLKVFLTTAEGHSIPAPQFFKQDLPRLRTIQRQVSKKVQGSINQREGKQHLARRHIRIADKRRDCHFQLAHELCDRYDTLILEDLNMEGMKRLWGRKVSDLGFAQFVSILKWVALKRGKRVVVIDRWERTTQTCSGCKTKRSLTLANRVWTCERCGRVHDRDYNAALNILEAWRRLILSPTSGRMSEEDLGKTQASGVNGRSLQV